MYNTQKNVAPNSGVGYLVVKVSTARGAIPLEGAAVNIRAADENASGILYSLRTDSDGLTDKVSLPAPARALSENPENAFPYATYDIDVFKDGYATLHFTDVAVFEGITSIQGAVMIPRPDSRYPDSYTIEEGSNPKDRHSLGGI